MNKFISFRSVVFWLVMFAISACSDNKDEKEVSLEGMWIAEIEMQDKVTPFKLDIETVTDSSAVAYIVNGKEKIKLDEITINGDSIVVPIHIFDISLELVKQKDGLNGVYIKHYEENYRLPIHLKKGSKKFQVKKDANYDYSGKWRVTFIEPKEKDTTEAVGIFKQNENKLTGTFLTPLGDYRYLTGVVDGNRLKLSTFDGNHAFLFKAEPVDENTISGHFYSGKDWYESWTAVKDPNAALPNPDSLTYIKKGYDGINFSFPNLDGKKVSLSDQKYQDKVVIIQLFGTWCPNCMDETKFLTEWYKKNSDEAVEIIGLAYEQKDDFNYAKARVEKMKNKWDVPYTLLIAGTSDKEEASKTLPMLNRVISFPTMIIIGKDGEVRNIHTGFSGPGTGKYYEEFITRFNQKMDNYLNE